MSDNGAWGGSSRLPPRLGDQRKPPMDQDKPAAVPEEGPLSPGDHDKPVTAPEEVSVHLEDAGR